MRIKKDGIYRDVPKHKLSEYTEKGYSVIEEKDGNADGGKNSKGKRLKNNA